MLQPKWFSSNSILYYFTLFNVTDFHQHGNFNQSDFLYHISFLHHKSFQFFILIYSLRFLLKFLNILLNLVKLLASFTIHQRNVKYVYYDHKIIWIRLSKLLRTAFLILTVEKWIVGLKNNWFLCIWKKMLC